MSAKMVKSVLHIGAHRTGTTSLQKFLRDNEKTLASENVATFCPPDTREFDFGSALGEKLSVFFQSSDAKIIISEENLLGTMEENIATQSLYPNAKKSLAKISSIYQPDLVYLTIRNTHDWWCSAISFCLSRGGVRFPSDQQLALISENRRGWPDVVEDVSTSFPNAKVVVREFGTMVDNPKRQLRVLTEWNIWKETKLNRRAHNRRPQSDELVTKLLDQANFVALALYGSFVDGSFFKSNEYHQLHSRFELDRQKLKATIGSRFWRDEGAPVVTTPKRNHSASRSAKQKTVLLHIGKTGGTYIKNLVEKEASEMESLHLGGHGDTLTSTIENFGVHRRLAFFYRDPESRFVSGFNSRLRQGRPIYNVNWTNAEAAAFSFFQTPSALAEALYSDNERDASAALFAMNSIFHLKHNLQFYLHSVEALTYENAASRIVICCETSTINKHLERIKRVLNIPAQSNINVEKNESPEKSQTALSSRAVENLRRFWTDEYTIYEACQKISLEKGWN